VNPFRTISEEVAAAYDKYLFHGRTLQDLPSDRSDPDATVKGPRFVLNATNVKTGSLWRFSKPYMADYRIGMIDWPRLPLAVAVAASSAFPPFLSPMRINLDDFNFRAGVPQPPPSRSLRSEAVLTDGGVYDNLGLEPVWKHYQTVLISDGGRKMDDDQAPATDWAWHSRRLIDLLQHEISNLRRRQAITSFQQNTRSGTYWGIQTDIDHYQFPGALVSHVSPATQRIAQIETRLAAMSEHTQELIMNWGYAVCDAAIRKHVLPNFAGPAAKWPFPNSPITADSQPT
jgi:NTE family protein